MNTTPLDATVLTWEEVKGMFPKGGNGFTAKEIFEEQNGNVGYTYDDLIVMPQHINFGVDEVMLETQFTRNISLRCPLASSPMDTVTEDKLAIAMANNGGIGIIHYNCTIEEQALMVRKVKTYRNGFIMSPKALSPTDSISDADAIRESEGHSGIPITHNGESHGKLVGFISRRDTDFVTDRTLPIESVMTPIGEVFTAPDGISLKEANQMLIENKRGTLPIINDLGELHSLVSRIDLLKSQAFPLASKDANKQLLAGAAIGTRPGDRDRLKALVEAGVDVLVIDSSQGDSIYQHDMIKHIKTNYPSVQVVAGNIVTAEQAFNLIKCGADGLRVGMGSGSICTTQDVCAAGRAACSAIYACSQVGNMFGVPVIADGGIGTTGCIIKAFCCGASACMMGSMFAGTEESPGDYFYADGKRLKRYRGMGCIEAMAQGSDKRYFAANAQVKVAQGVSGSVVDKGSISRYVPYLMQGSCCCCCCCWCEIELTLLFVICALGLLWLLCAGLVIFIYLLSMYACARNQTRVPRHWCGLPESSPRNEG
jgi:IMP dehydrogenase